MLSQHGPLSGQALDLPATLADAGLKVSAAIFELTLLGLESLDGRVQFAHARLQRTALALMGSRQLLFGRKGDFGVVENLTRGVPAVAQVFQPTAQFGHQSGGVEFALFPFGHLGGQRFALLEIARLLARQGVQVAVHLAQADFQRALGGLEGIELTLTGGHGDLLLTQFHPHLFQRQLQGGLFELQGRLFLGGLREASLKGGDLGLEFGDLIFAPQNAGRCLARGALCSTGKHSQASENLAHRRNKVPASPCPSRQSEGRVQVGHDERATEQSHYQWRNRGLNFENRQGSDHSFGQSRGRLGRSRCQEG